MNGLCMDGYDKYIKLTTINWQPLYNIFHMFHVQQHNSNWFNSYQVPSLGVNLKDLGLDAGRGFEQPWNFGINRNSQSSVQ